MPNPKKPRAHCLACGKEVQRAVDKFCDNRCQGEYQYKVYIERWLAGLETGLKGRFFALSDNVRRWLRETHGEKCSQCGWAEQHPVTGRIPLQIDHIDGDVANCRPANLRFLCPNCHSLTPTYGSLNRGNGRRPHHKGGYSTPG
ncbi:MAG TPA: HNH endonuclease [Chloroflexi bacterium]|nr:HNH endonuclease [Chloroflexota bacterium]